MALSLQINSLLYCFLYGLFFSLGYNLNYKIMKDAKMLFKILVDFVFVLNNILLFYIILLKINFGVIHPYFIMMLAIGFIVGNKHYYLVSSKLTKKDNN